MKREAKERGWGGEPEDEEEDEDEEVITGKPGDERGGEPPQERAHRIDRIEVPSEDDADQAWLAAREHGGGPLPHIDPQHAESYQRMEEAIADLPMLMAPAGWEEVVRAGLDANERTEREGPAREEPEVGRPVTVLGAKGPAPARGEEAQPAACATAVEAPAALEQADQEPAGAKARGLAPGQPRRRLWIGAVSAVAMAAGVMLLVSRTPTSVPSDPPPKEETGAPRLATSSPELSPSIVYNSARTRREEPGPAPQRDPAPSTSSPLGTAPLGDTFKLDFTARRGQVRLYRDRREIARCPGAQECELEHLGEQVRFRLRYPMSVPGEYRAVYFEGTAMDAASGGLNQDLKRCRQLAEGGSSAAPICEWKMSTAFNAQ